MVALLLFGNWSEANSIALFAFYALAASVAALIGSTITREIRRARATNTK
jgi:hypothetical protein